MARLKPPYPPPGVDPRWLGLGLKAAWSFNEGAGSPRDALNRLVATLASSDWGSGAQGPVIVHDATTDRTELAANSSTQLLPTGNVTIILGSRKTDATNRDSGAFGVDTATAAEYCAVKLPAADGTVYWDYGGVTAGTTRLAAASLTFGDDTFGFTVGARGMEIWQNGVLRASNAANPTRTATSAAFKLGLYDSALAGDLAAYNCIYVFAGQLSQDDIALLTSDPARLFLDQHSADRAMVLHSGVIASANTAAAFEIIRSGRTLRAERTAVPERQAVYGYCDGLHVLDIYLPTHTYTDSKCVLDAPLTSYGYTDQRHGLVAIDPVAYVYTDQRHGLQAIDAVSHIYTDQGHELSVYGPTHGYTDAKQALNAYEIAYGFGDALHALQAPELAYAYSDSLSVLGAYTISYGYTDASQALKAYELWRGVLDQLQRLDAYAPAQYSFTDGLSGLAAYTTSYGFTDGRHALLAATEVLRGWTDSQHALEVRALAFGYADQAHALGTYSLSYGYQDGQYSLNAWQALYGFLDTLHTLDARAVAYGYSDFRNTLDADAVFYGWVLNAATEAASRYESFNFNSFCEIDASRYLGASSAGIHELGGGTDAGTAIAALVLSGLDDFQSDHQKRLTDAYIAAESDGKLTLKVTADGVTDTYTLAESGALKNRKVPLGKGRKGRYWQFELDNQDGAGFTLDKVSVNAEVLSRRV